MSSRARRMQGLSGITRVVTGALVALGITTGAALAAPQTAPFQELDNIEGSFVNLNLFPVRPMVVAPDTGDLFVANTNANTVERFVVGATTPGDVYPVPWGPVSIAH